MRAPSNSGAKGSGGESATVGSSPGASGPDASTEPLPRRGRGDRGFAAALPRQGAGVSASTRPAAPAVGAAEVAPLGRLLAYVWPAVALGPAMKVLAILAPGALPDQGGENPFAAPDWVRRFSPVSIATPSGGASGLFERAATTTATSEPAPYHSPLPGGEGMSLLVAVLAVFGALIGGVALARLAVGEEFFSMRWLH